jgi:predicted NBD/HSP70 family sugar kinase
MVRSAPPADLSGDRLAGLMTVLNLIRNRQATTRLEVEQRTGLGRTAVTQRVERLVELGLAQEDVPAKAAIGRPPRGLSFVKDRGHLLVADLGVTSIRAGVTDLDGQVLAATEEPLDIAAGPDVVLGRLGELFDTLLKERTDTHAPVWAVGIGIPARVEFSSGRPIAPPVMPGWDNYPIREHLTERFNVPAWIDNDVNVLAVGELRAGVARNLSDALFVKVGSGIGAGLISHGQLHRGARGCAGDIGHISVTDDPAVVCRCGNIGCLEAVAGGAALVREATNLARDGRSAFFADRLAAAGTLQIGDVVQALSHGDPYAVVMLDRAADLVGKVLAGLVNFYNPSLIMIGGHVTGYDDRFLARIRQAVYQRSSPLATRELRISRPLLSGEARLQGAAFIVIDELFTPATLSRWIHAGTPVGVVQQVDESSIA